MAHTHHFQPSPRGKFEVCDCGERFPCAEDTCGHLDCIEVRGKAPRCHFCRKIVSGPRNEAWGTGNVRNITRTFHYTCKENRDGEERAEGAGAEAAAGDREGVRPGAEPELGHAAGSGEER